MKTSEHKAKSESWRNRIVDRGEVAASNLTAHPFNWRTHSDQQKAILSSVLENVGWVQDVIVNKRTGRMVDGHLRVQLAAERGENVPVLYVDLSESEEALVLASLDPIGSIAGADADSLENLLASVELVDPMLDDFLSGLLDSAESVSLKDESDDSEDKDDSVRNLGDSHKQIKAVLYADQIAVFEQALKATGERNRGEALMKVCRVYIDRAERQLDILDEIPAAR